MDYKCRCGELVSYEARKCPKCGLIPNPYGPEKPTESDFNGWDIIEYDELREIEDEIIGNVIEKFKAIPRSGFFPNWLDKRVAYSVQRMLDKSSVLKLEVSGDDEVDLVFGLCRQGIEDDGQWTARFDLIEVFKKAEFFRKAHQKTAVAKLQECIKYIESYNGDFLDDEGDDDGMGDDL